MALNDGLASLASNPARLKAGTLYGVAVAPFLATPCMDSHAPDMTRTSSGDGGWVALSVTPDTDLAPQRVTLPMWFAKQLCSFCDVAEGMAPPTPPPGSKPGQSLACDNAAVWSPTCAVDRHARLVITPAQSPPPARGLSKVGVISQASMTALPVLGTDGERRACAELSAYHVLAAQNAVPHRVVPSVVFEHVVAPYVADACCSLEDSHVGVVSLTQENSAVPAYDSFPNLKRLELFGGDDDGPLPGSIESLVVHRTPLSLCRLAQRLPTARHLRSLVLACECDVVDELEAAAARPLLTLEALVVNDFGFPSAEADTKRYRLALLGACFPNIQALRCFQGIGREDAWIVEHFRAAAVWPRLGTLDIAGSYMVSVVATRPSAWTHLTLRPDWFSMSVVEESGLVAPVCIPNVVYLYVGCSEAWGRFDLAGASALRVLHTPRCVVAADAIAAPRLVHLSIAAPSADVNDHALFTPVDVASGAENLNCRGTLRRVSFQNRGVFHQRAGPGESWRAGCSPPRRGIRHERFEQWLLPSEKDCELLVWRLGCDYLRDQLQLAKEHFTPQPSHTLPFRLFAPSAGDRRGLLLPPPDMRLRPR